MQPDCMMCDDDKYVTKVRLFVLVGENWVLVVCLCL